MIRDACRGIPVKTPAQQHIQVGLKSGINVSLVAKNPVYFNDD